MTRQPSIAAGFLVYPADRLVLLHLRGPENDPDPHVWAAIGGHEEPEDAGNLRQTWCRELGEELGIEANSSRVQEVITHQLGDGRHATVFVLPVESTSLLVTLNEGRGLAWFSIEQALALPNLAAVTRNDLPRIADWLESVSPETLQRPERVPPAP